MPEILEDGDNGLPGTMRNLLERLTEHLQEMDRQVDELETQIMRWHRENEASRRLAEIAGIGPITASAIVATVGRASEFKNGRQMAAWMGLVPRQHSSGGKQNLAGHQQARRHLPTDIADPWGEGCDSSCREQGRARKLAEKLMARRNKNVAAVALANKNARIVWALWQRAEHTSPTTPRQP